MHFILSLTIYTYAVLISASGTTTNEHARKPAPRTIRAAEYPDLQSAFNALPESGGSIQLPVGSFELEQPLVLHTENTLIVGQGPATHLINRNEQGRPAIILRPQSRMADKAARIWRVQLENFRISGNPKSGDGILAEGVNELSIHGLSIDHNGGHGINMIDCYEDPRIAHCLLTYNGFAGLNILSGHDIIVSGNQFEENQDALRCIDSFNLCMNGNNLDDHLRHGIVIENTYGSVLSGNMIEECIGTAVILDRDCYGITISSNVIAHELAGGVDLRDAWGCTISGNTFTIVHQFGVRVGKNSGRIAISGNNFTNSHIGNGTRRIAKEDDNLLRLDVGSGVQLMETADVVVSGNVFTGMSRSGISADNKCRRLLISNNLFFDLNRRTPEPGLPLQVPPHDSHLMKNNLMPEASPR